MCPSSSSRATRGPTRSGAHTTLGATDFEGKNVPATVLSQRAQFLLRARSTVEALHESERRLEAAQRIARVGSWEWDPRSDRHNWSPMTRELLGHPRFPRPITHADFLAAVREEDRSGVEHVMNSARVAPDGPIDFRTRHADGTELILQLRAEPFADVSGARIGVAGTIQDVTGIRQAAHRIRQLAYFDPVTGLPNRTLFLERLRAAIADARRRDTHLGVVLLDLDDFKTANDTLGHAVGDRLLKAVANRLRNAVRATDVVSRVDGTDLEDFALGRLAGDEFVVLLADVRRDEGAGLATARLLNSLESPFDIDGREVFLSASAGIAMYPRDALEAGTLLTHADTAMYAAKATGRSALRFFNLALNEMATERLHLEGGLRRAIDRLEFHLHFQPIVNAPTGEVAGAECLIRWLHPELGLILPSRFLPVAEESGLITPLTEWVVRAACAQHREWAALGCVVPLSFNVSSHDFQSDGFADRICRIVADSGAEPGLLTVEITESVLLRDSDTMRENVKRLRAFGLCFAIDDFGTGYSSLGYLRRFPIDQIKIDRSFVRDLDNDPAAAAIAEAVALISGRVGIKTVAEGVETERQRDILTALSFERMQGFLFARAMPANEFLEYFQASLLPTEMGAAG